MFTVLEIVPYQREKHFWRRWRQKTPLPKIERIALRGGAYFYSVKAFADKDGRIDETAIYSVVGSSIYRTILKAGTKAPAFEIVRLFHPTLYPSLLFCNTALAYLQERKANRTERILGVADQNAQLLDAVLPFAPLAKQIYIFTAKAEKYAPTAQKLLDTYGLPLLVTSDTQKIKKCTVVIEPFRREKDEVFGVLRSCEGPEDIWKGEGVQLPAEAEKRMPEKTDSVVFAAALYEICNCRGLDRLTYAHLKRIKPLQLLT